MNKYISIFIVLSTSLLMIFSLSSCGSGDKNAFGMDQFSNEMKKRNYSFNIEDAKSNFLPTTRKRMIMGEEVIEIYIYKNNTSMENDAKNIEPNGFGYDSRGFLGGRAMKVEWVSDPHFYKKGNVIVQYIGKNKKIISDLKDILGPQFAGM